MALADIIAAISAKADASIAAARKAHQQALSDLKDQATKSIDQNKQNIAMQKEAKKKQMRLKSEAHAQMIERNAELQKKQELLDQLYGAVVTELHNLSDSDKESLLKAFLAEISGAGEIRPAKCCEPILKKLVSGDVTLGSTIDAAGGFIFTSDREEQDFTFEHIVATKLRPETEVETAKTLFV